MTWFVLIRLIAFSTLPPMLRLWPPLKNMTWLFGVNLSRLAPARKASVWFGFLCLRVMLFGVRSLLVMCVSLFCVKIFWLRSLVWTVLPTV